MSLLTLFLACAQRQEPAAEPPMPTDDCAPSMSGHFVLTDYPGKDAVGPSGERPMPMSREYTFTEQDYRMEGYPPLTITGRYAVLATEGQRLKLALTDTIFDGAPSEDAEVWVAFSDCGKTMVMEGMTYARQPAG